MLKGRDITILGRLDDQTIMGIKQNHEIENRTTNRTSAVRSV